MNNIEILEEKIKIIESLCTDDCINKSTVIQPLKYAIENLIQENKELRIQISARETVVDKLTKENKELEKMLKLKSHKRKYNTLNYIKKNKLNKFDTVGVCQDMRAFKRTGEIKYRAYITFQNKQYTLGTYTSLNKAKEARKKGEIMIENIKKNFVEKIKGEE